MCQTGPAAGQLSVWLPTGDTSTPSSFLLPFLVPFLFYSACGIDQACIHDHVDGDTSSSFSASQGYTRALPPLSRKYLKPRQHSTAPECELSSVPELPRLHFAHQPQLIMTENQQE
ncbi:hypothetical protein E2C01_015815 [Portunus trituberculatus]|uniref:Uncharacterized protein n=1 Tax=Portunus trituberculatus TaxID=210409 RepID=A0A5B7DNY7_PORTR|nr:hypothetical protein [Portunus trituberculatus]